MKRIFFSIIVLSTIMLSCTKNFEDFNTDKKHPSEVPGIHLFANAQRALGDQEASTNVNLNIFKLWSQYWTETTYTDEANYDIVTRTIADNTFRVYYRDVLMDLKDAKKAFEAEEVQGTEALAAKANRLYIVDIMEVFVYSKLISIFGNVPYSEALDVNNNIFPGYDDGLTVHKALIERLSADINGISGSESFATGDLYFGGDADMWKKFANSLKVKLGMLLADVDNGLAKQTVEAAYTGAFSMGEDCRLNYEGGSNSNPLYQDLIQSGRHDFVPANTIVDIMNTLTDPRRPYYFTYLEGTTDYVGGEYGFSNNFSQRSHIADPIQEPTYPMILLDYTELAFLLAEAAERGYSVGGSAQAHYNSGIESSILSWGGTQDEVDAYLAQTNVAYGTATGDWKQKIGTQAWIALYTRGLEGYTSWRRLDYPILNIAPTLTNYNEIPTRFTFPIREQTLNAENYAAAASAVGGDELTTKLYWDKN